MLLRRLKIENATVHGFRSSFRDWCGDETSFPREIAEAALAHRTGNATERAYRRRDAFDKRRQLMAAWAAYCAADETSNVIAFGRRGKRALARMGGREDGLVMGRQGTSQ